MKVPPKEKNILIIRSATRILDPTLNALKKEFPESKITVLAPKAVETVVSKDPLVDQVLTIGNHRRMSVFNYGWKRLQQFQKLKFDLAVSLYNVDHGLGYSNIDLLAWASRAREIRGYNPRGTYVNLTGRDVLKKWFLEKTTLFWAGLNFIATVILFSCITFGIIGEWCFRKLSSTQKNPLKDLAQEKEPIVGKTSSSTEVPKLLTRV